MSDKGDKPEIRHIPMPTWRHLPSGWFEAVWHIGCPGGINLAEFVLPPIPSALVLTRVVLAIVPQRDDLAHVVVLTDDERNPHVLAYLSLVMQRLAAVAAGDLDVEGIGRHPILRLCGEEA